MLGGLIVAAAVATATLTGASNVRLAGRDIRLVDVAAVAGPAAPALRRLVIAHLPKANTAVKLSRTQLAALIRRAVPGATVAGDMTGSITICFVEPVTPRPILKSYVAAATAVERGQTLTLAARAGPVLIERPVVALQSARKQDKRLFVRAEDGQVFSAPIASEAAR